MSSTSKGLPLEHSQAPAGEGTPLDYEAGGSLRSRGVGSRTGTLRDRVAERVKPIVEARRTVFADVWQALWISRLAVWLTAIYAVLAVGFLPTGHAPNSGAPFGHLGEILFGPAVRWDGGFYVSIALHSYHAGPVSAFFPIYPIAIGGVNFFLGSAIVAGIIISIASFAVALYFLHRLVTLELGSEHARTAVLVLAFFPTALFFSMDYPEALLLALSIGAVYAARTAHWAWACILGALAAATHNSGVLVAIPIGLLYLYGPRSDGERSRVQRSSRWLPRYRLRFNVLWLALVPLGLIAFFAYMGLEFGDPLRPLHLNDTLWHRHFKFLGGVTGIVGVLSRGVHTIASVPSEKLFPRTNGPYRAVAVNVVDAAALVFAVCAAIRVVRRLPLAYSVYTVVSLAMLVSAPKAAEPLASLPRYILVLFPLHMAFAGWIDERRRPMVWLAVSGLAMGVLSMQFATGRWVA